MRAKAAIPLTSPKHIRVVKYLLMGYSSERISKLLEVRVEVVNYMKATGKW